MKFCVKCGKELEGNSVGCPNCDSVAQNGAEKKGKVLKNKKIFIGVIAATVVALVVILIIIFTGGGYEKIIDNYINIEYYALYNEENIRPLAPESLWEEWADEEEYEDVEEMFEEWNDNLDGYDEYYENVSFDIEYEITSEEELSKKELDDICEGLEEAYDANYSEFTEGYTFKLKVTGEIDGEYSNGRSAYKEVNDKRNLTVVKMNGKWYFVSGNRWLIDILW